MRYLKLLSVLAVAFFLTLGLTLGPATFAQKKFVVYFIPHAGMADPFWATQIKMAKAIAAHFPDLELRVTAPETYSIKKQLDYLMAAIAAKPDAIIVTISDAKAMDKPLRKAIAEGILVIAINIEDYRPPDKRIPYITYIGMDERISGSVLAEETYKRFHEAFGRYPKRAVIGIHQPGLICLEMRSDGIMKVSKELGIPVEKLDITMDPTKAMEILRAYLTKHPDTEVIFTLGPCGSHPAIRLIKELGAKGKILHGCIDLSPKILDAIKEGITVVAVSQQPAFQAAQSVYTAYLYLKYGIIPPKILPTGPTVVTKENLSVILRQVKTTGGA